MSGVKVNVETLREFEKPLMGTNNAYIDVLRGIKACQDAIGEGTGIEESIERDGKSLEKAFNEEVVPSVQNVLQTLAASADNAEDIQKVMAQFDAVNTAAVSDTQVSVGARPAAFSRG